MRILVTNDDGIDSEGIHVLARALAATEHDVVVVAPDRDWSGAGAALGSFDVDVAVGIQRAEIPEAPDIEAWAVDGPPALCLVAGRLGGFGDPPDLVVSGINAGVNTGRSVLHSGTVGAALAGQNFGISGLAVSVDSAPTWHWEAAAALAVETLDLLIAAPTCSVLNLNVPARPRDQIPGIRWARLAPFGAVRATVSGGDDTSLEVELQPTDYDPPPDTDQGAINAGWASLTTIVGIVEAWPLAPEESVEMDVHLAPGAALHHVHTVPDGSVASVLLRPHRAE
jgi:5'-nucleotidase